MRKVFGILALMASSVSIAAEPDAVVRVGYGSGSGDIVSDGSKTSFDLDGYSITGFFYLNNNVAVEVGLGKNSADVSIGGTKYESDVDVKSFGLSYVFGGRVDTWLGEGSENQLSVTYTESDDTTTSPGVNVNETYNATSIGYTRMQGLGDGFVAAGSIEIDSDELFDERSLSVSLSKSLTEQLAIAGVYTNVNSKETTTESGAEYSVFAVELALSF